MFRYFEIKNFAFPSEFSFQILKRLFKSSTVVSLLISINVMYFEKKVPPVKPTE